MNALMWALRLFLFLVLFGFAIKNDHPVSLHFFFDANWNLPLVFVILFAFVAGTFIGMSAAFVSWLSHQREVRRLRRELSRERDKRAERVEPSPAQAGPPS
jgi:lipopolysaccharide assembly protein A